MEATVGFGVPLHGIECLVPVSVEQAAGLLKLGFALREIVVVNEIVPRVVGRIDVDHFHLAEIGFPQGFKDFEVVALDVEVLGIVEIDAFFATGAERLGGRGIGIADGFAFARPSKLVAFFAFANELVAQLGLQFFKINR